MKKILVGSLLILTSIGIILNNQPAKAETVETDDVEPDGIIFNNQPAKAETVETDDVEPDGIIFNNQPAKTETVETDDFEPKEDYHFRINHHFGRSHNRHYHKHPKTKIKYCYPVNHESVRKDPAYHPNAYEDGYRQGEENASKGKPYKARTAGGEFGRGFDDGYFGREFTGQKRTIPNKVSYYTTTECNTYLH